MSIICKDTITNLKYLSQNVMTSVDLINLIVAINSATVHLYFVARQRTAAPGRPARLGTPRSGAPSGGGPADWPAWCAAALQHSLDDGDVFLLFRHFSDFPTFFPTF